MQVVLEQSWKEMLKGEFEKPYFKALTEFVEAEYTAGIVYPNSNNVFTAFHLTPFHKVKVVILGQDPYHGAGQANGLSFAVSGEQRLPPSLQNIFKEVESDLGQPLLHRDGDLSRWATQGVLLLNSTLTVCAGTPGSHQGHGWEQFTDSVIQALSDKREHLVFILWGNYAKAKGVHIDRSKHLVLESPHPSPFSAHSGFLGSKPFSRTNKYLIQNGGEEIEWL